MSEVSDQLAMYCPALAWQKSRAWFCHRSRLTIVNDEDFADFTLVPDNNASASASTMPSSSTTTPGDPMEVDTVTSPGIIIEELDEEGEPWNVLTTPDRQQ